MSGWKMFVLGLIAGVAGVLVVVFGYFLLGIAPASVSAAPMPFERYLSHHALHAQVEGAADTPAPIEPTEANLLAGARLYRSSCAFCHSLPGQGRTKVQEGMYPKPPELLSGKGVTDDPVGETHWVVKNGIRLTGMPAFDGAYSDQQLWEVSLLLSHAHELPASVQQLLSRPDEIPVPSQQ